MYHIYNQPAQFACDVNESKPHLHPFAELHKSRALDNGLGASSNYVDEAMGFHSDRSVSIPNIWFFTIVKSDAVNDSVLTVQILS